MFHFLSETALDLLHRKSSFSVSQKTQSIVTLIIYFYCFQCFVQTFCFISLYIHADYSFFYSINFFLKSRKQVSFNNTRQFSLLALISFLFSHISILICIERLNCSLKPNNTYVHPLCPRVLLLD